ncbi:MAG: glycosyltransferase [Bosea sp. (in: a-proteobacteria)]
MNVLFIHWMFPCQFQHLAPALMAAGHHVRAIMDAREKKPDGFQVSTYDATPYEPDNNQLGWHISPRMRRGEWVARAAENMAREGFIPDLIIGHYGKGECIYIKDVFPNARLICYADIFFRMEDALFDPEFSKDDLHERMKMTSLAPLFLMSAYRADMLWAATKWQASTFPAMFRDKTEVVFDGIDCDRCSPDPGVALALSNKGLELHHGDEILLFAARNLEPTRGYHRFMRVLPEIMRRRPGVQTLIVGGHHVTYSAPPPAGTSWKSVFLREVQAELDPKRTHILDSQPYDRFLELVQIARAQIYLSHPYILSWSFFEAMSCGTMMIGSRNGPVEEVLEDGINGRLVDMFSDQEIIDRTVDALANPRAHLPMRKQARETMLSRYDAKRVCLQQQLGMVSRVMA